MTIPNQVTYDRKHHARTSAHLSGQLKPKSTKSIALSGNRFSRFNNRIGLGVTMIVGTMWAAYLFTLLALISAPSAFQSGDKLIIVAWIAQTFLQLVLLPVIIVGQNIQSKASDKRAEDTLEDARATLHEADQLQQHLVAQDAVLNQLITRLETALSQPATSHMHIVEQAKEVGKAATGVAARVTKRSTATKPAAKTTPAPRRAK